MLLKCHMIVLARDFTRPAERNFVIGVVLFRVSYLRNNARFAFFMFCMISYASSLYAHACGFFCAFV